MQERDPKLLPSPERAHNHERTDASVSGIVKFAIGLVVALVAIDAALRWGFVELHKHDPVADEPPGGDPHERVPPGPHLQISDAYDMAALRRAEDQRLTTYGWIDDQRQFAHVPIVGAMEAMVDTGLPKWPPAQGAAARPEKRKAPLPGPTLNTPANREQSERNP